MYTHHDERSVEAVCYEETHVKEVLAEIKEHFDDYFMSFIETEGGIGITDEAFKKLRRHFGVQNKERLY